MHHAFHRRAELAKHLGRLDVRVAVDGDDATRPHEHDSGCREHLSGHRDGDRTDAVVQHDDVGSMLDEGRGQLGTGRRGGDDLHALTLENEGQKSLSLRPPLPDDHADALLFHLHSLDSCRAESLVAAPRPGFGRWSDHRAQRA